MKPSMYNVFVGDRGGAWGFNTRSAALVRLTAGDWRRVRRLLDGDETPGRSRKSRELLEGLVRGQFLIPDDLDELAVLKVKNHIARFAGRGISLIIAPTLRCNFMCPYCYVDRNASRMRPEVRDRVARFFDRKLVEGTQASVCWTGGDPSLALDVVEDLTARFIAACEAKQVRYHSVGISNGYRLDGEMVATLKRCRVSALQVSLDGAQPFHDSTRALANGRPTYVRILDNVLAASDEITINLRINLDTKNVGSLPELLDDLGRRGLAGKVGLYFAHVEALNDQSAPYRASCLSRERYADDESRFLAMALDRGFHIAGGALNNVRGCYCGANTLNHFVVDPAGQLLKCYEDLGSADRHGIGRIDEEGEEVITLPRNQLGWLSWDPFEHEECLACKVLPLCMGGCSYQMVRNGLGIGPGCLKLRYNLEDIVRLYGERLARRRAQVTPLDDPAVTCAEA